TRFSRDWSSDVCSSDLVLAVRGVAHTAVHSVAQRAGNRRRRGEGQHQRDVVFLQVVIQLTVGHAGLDQGSTQLSVDVKDLVHLLQVEDDLTALPRCGGAITEVAAGGDGPDRNLVFVTDLHHTLDLLHGGGGDGCRRRMVSVLRRHHDLVVGDELLVFHQHIVIAQQGAELGHGLLKLGRGYTLRQKLIGLLGHADWLLPVSIENETKWPLSGKC